MGSNPSKSQKHLRKLGLIYVSDEDPGIERRRVRRSFTYVDPHGRRVSDEEVLTRIRSLVIPPAWEGVWICAVPHGHIQATGRDARNRKQYRYHARFREHRQETKFHKMISFAESLPKIRRKVRAHLRLRGLPRERVLATVVRLLETTHVRVGNSEYAKENRSFGLTTIQDRHVRKRGAGIQFRFKGKSGVAHDVSVDDARVARIVLRCQDLPGQHLFQYLTGEGEHRNVGSVDVNSYIREISGGDFSAKDFRTWAGTIMAEVAAGLRNRPATCRAYYVHPVILEYYLAGTLHSELERGRRAARSSRGIVGLTRHEEGVLSLLKRAGAH
jgi:DNA topoisomerase I